MVESAVINASPLIFLARSRHLDLLQAFASEIWIPESVADEIRQRGPHDATAQAFADTDWFIVKPVSAIPATITEWRLGAGESAVLTLAAEHHLEAIVDDLAGRKCAASLNIPVRGTLGIVLVAKQRGVIPEARPVIEDMMKAGLYLSKKVLDKAMQRIGE